MASMEVFAQRDRASSSDHSLHAREYSRLLHGVQRKVLFVEQARFECELHDAITKLLRYIQAIEAYQKFVKNTVIKGWSVGSHVEILAREQVERDALAARGLRETRATLDLTER